MDRAPNKPKLIVRTKFLDVCTKFSYARLRLADSYGLQINNAGIVGATAEIDTTIVLQKVSSGDRGSGCIKQLVGKSAMERLQWLLQHSTETYDEAEECLRINYIGTKYVTEALLPLLQSSSDGRIINVSSNYELLRDSFLEDYRNGHLKSHGWPADAEYLAYKVSKALINGTLE
uniref:Uncharacterized protein n=1 Tax=Leersia perrieri TaxID=77586 RepID=A0A0D9W7I4_9ORYZ